MLEYHRSPQPENCDVCEYVLEHGLKVDDEHALVRLATTFLLEDLEVDGGDLPLRSLAVRESGFAPGPVHELDPRHWYWAMFYEPRIRLILQTGRRRP